ncbi:MAG: electron transfer flavoprotein subunit alpha/FixB family protein, partial [Mesorhizobium sp.]
MAILLVGEHGNHTLSDQAAKALTVALEIGPEVDALGAKTAANAAARLKGVRKILLADADGYDKLVEPATAGGRPPRGHAGARDHRRGFARHFQTSDLGRQRHLDRAVDRSVEDHCGTDGCFPLACQSNSAVGEHVSAAADPDLSSFVEHRLAEGDRPELTSAK